MNVMPDSSIAVTPETYNNVRQPLAKAQTLPPWTYTSEEFYRIEIERIFRKVWNCIGRVERIPDPGSYFTLDLAGVPLIVARDNDNTVRAFANSCRHRGTMVASGEGHCRTFTCPYHSWTYDLQGRLISAPTEMDKTEDFRLDNHGLVPIRLETWAGFIFITFNDSAESLDTYLGDLPNLVAPYALDQLVCVRRRFYDVACNWKVYLENTKDQLHVTSVHRTSLNRVAPPMKMNRQVQETHGNYVSSFLEVPGSMALLKGEEGFPKLPSLEGAALQRTTTPVVLPTVYIGCTIDCAYYLRIQPVGVDRIVLEQGGMFPREVIERPDFGTRAKGYYKRWDTTAREDNDVCELQQRGLTSPFACPGRFSHREEILHRISNWIIDRILE